MLRRELKDHDTGRIVRTSVKRPAAPRSYRWKPTANLFYGTKIFSFPGLTEHDIGCQLWFRCIHQARETPDPDTGNGLDRNTDYDLAVLEKLPAPIFGLLMTSTDFYCRALIVTSAPFSVRLKHMTTGIGSRVTICLRKDKPSMRGISPSRVIKSGSGVRILSSAISGSAAPLLLSITGSATEPQ